MSRRLRRGLGQASRGWGWKRGGLEVRSCYCWVLLMLLEWRRGVNGDWIWDGGCRRSGFEKKRGRPNEVTGSIEVMFDWATRHRRKYLTFSQRRLGWIGFDVKPHTGLGLYILPMVGQQDLSSSIYTPIHGLVLVQKEECYERVGSSQFLGGRIGEICGSGYIWVTLRWRSGKITECLFENHVNNVDVEHDV